MGDVPITSYFSLKPVHGKRRQTGGASVTPQHKKHKPRQPNRTPPTITASKKESDAETSANSSGTRGESRGSTDRTIESEWPLTPNTQSLPPHREKHQVTVSPVISPDVKATMRSPRSTGTLCSLDSHSIHVAFKPSPNLLPTPKSLSQPRSRLAKPHEMHDSPCKMVTTAPVPCLTNDPIDAYEDSIPSSQSQYMDESRFDIRIQPTGKYSSAQTSLDSDVNEKVVIPSRSGAQVSGTSICDEIAPSSQTQLLDPLDNTPRKLRGSQIIVDTKWRQFTETIPSSQSDEVELFLPRDNSPSPVSCPQRFVFPSAVSAVSGSSSDPLTDTVISRSEKPASDPHYSDARNTDTYPSNLAHRVSPSKSPFSSASPFEGRKLHDNTDSEKEDIPSLPPALTDFQNMFDDNDDSYPPDFPMSLRF